MLIIREKIRKDMLQNIEEITYFDEMLMKYYDAYIC